MSTSFNYTPPPSLVPFFQNSAKMRFVRGPIGSVKSTAMVMELFRRACERLPDSDGVRRSKFAVVRNTFRQLEETCLVTIQKTLGPLVRYKVSAHKAMLRFDMGPLLDPQTKKVLEPGPRPVESDWLLWPLDSPENVQNLLSLELTGAWVSEFREIAPQIVMDLFSRTGRYVGELSMADGAVSTPASLPDQWYGVIAETNSFSEDSPWYELLELNLRPSWGYVVQPGAYDPRADWKQYLPTETYYEDLLENHTEAWAEQYIHNRITPSLSSQAVFARSFDSELHIVPSLEFNPHRPLVLGMDTGRQPAFVAGQLSAAGRLNVLGSLHAENCGMELFLSDHVRPWLAGRYPRAAVFMIIDPAGRTRDQIGERSVLQVIQDAGFKAVLAVTNNITPRLRAVEKYLNRRGGFAVAADGNELLIRALRHDYRFKRDRDGALLEVPVKSHPASDYCFVGGTPVLASNGYTPIEMLRPGDEVVTPSGLSHVVAASSRMVTELVEVELSNGVALTCTPDHPFITDEGWTCAAADLRSGVGLYNVRNVGWLRPFYSSLAVFSSNASRNGEVLELRVVNVSSVSSGLLPKRGRMVYALQVDKDPVYFVADALVKNCDALQYLALGINSDLMGRAMAQLGMANVPKPAPVSAGGWT